MKFVIGFWVLVFFVVCCIVLMCGYFEWMGEKGDKILYFFYGDGLFFVVGFIWLMEFFDGECFCCFVVIICEVCDVSGEVYDWMLVFFIFDMWDFWFMLEKFIGEWKVEMFVMFEYMFFDVVVMICEYVVDWKVNNFCIVDVIDLLLIEFVVIG